MPYYSTLQVSTVDHALVLCDYKHWVCVWQGLLYLTDGLGHTQALEKLGIHGSRHELAALYYCQPLNLMERSTSWPCLKEGHRPKQDGPALARFVNFLTSLEELQCLRRTQ